MLRWVGKRRRKRTSKRNSRKKRKRTGRGVRERGVVGHEKYQQSLVPREGLPATIQGSKMIKFNCFHRGINVRGAETWVERPETYFMDYHQYIGKDFTQTHTFCTEPKTSSSDENLLSLRVSLTGQNIWKSLGLGRHLDPPVE
jgi:hypothetical protein